MRIEDFNNFAKAFYTIQEYPEIFDDRCCILGIDACGSTYLELGTKYYLWDNNMSSFILLTKNKSEYNERIIKIDINSDSIQLKRVIELISLEKESIHCFSIEDLESVKYVYNEFMDEFVAYKEEIPIYRLQVVRPTAESNEGYEVRQLKVN